MVWYNFTKSLVTALLISLWQQHVRAHLPLMSSDGTHDATQQTIDVLETSLLNILGMKIRPSRPRTNIQIPQFMLDLYRQQTSDPEDISLNFKKKNALNANTARSYSHIGSKSSDDPSIVNLFFNVTDIPEDETVVAAELQLFQHNMSAHANITNKLEVYEILSGHQSVEGAIIRLLDSQKITTQGWQYLDISPSVKRWRSKPRKVLGVQVRVKQINGERTHSHSVRLRRDASSSVEDWTVQKPLLVVYTLDEKHSRLRRSNTQKKQKVGRKNPNRECQRREMRVDFKSLGWEDWILAPLWYDAFYCSGECPFPLSQFQNATNHAIVQSIYHEIDPKAVPKPCCVPSDLSPISMLYLNGREVVLKNYQDMVVEGCGCR